MPTNVIGSSPTSRFAAGVCLAMSLSVFLVPIHVAHAHHEFDVHHRESADPTHDHTHRHHPDDDHESAPAEHGEEHSALDHALAKGTPDPVAVEGPALAPFLPPIPADSGARMRPPDVPAPSSCSDRVSPHSPRSPPTA